MFTGLVQAVGAIEAVATRGTARVLTVAAPWDDYETGESIACDGVCLTVERFSSGRFEVALGEETLRRTTLGGRGVGHRLHLERALRVGDRLGGHIVTGHVDGVGRVEVSEGSPSFWRLGVVLPAGLERFVVEKGSVCVEGVSLTVNGVSGRRFDVGLVPHTLSVTRLGALRVGDPVNVEVDVLARYVERLLGGGAGGLTRERLVRAGFDQE